MTSLTSSRQGFEHLLDLSRQLTRGIDTPLPSVTPRVTRRGGLTAALATLGERWARNRAAEAWQELALHDRRMAQQLHAALARDAGR